MQQADGVARLRAINAGPATVGIGLQPGNLTEAASRRRRVVDEALKDASSRMTSATRTSSTTGTSKPSPSPGKTYRDGVAGSGLKSRPSKLLPACAAVPRDLEAPAWRLQYRHSKQGIDRDDLSWLAGACRRRRRETGRWNVEWPSAGETAAAVDLAKNLEVKVSELGIDLFKTTAENEAAGDGVRARAAGSRATRRVFPPLTQIAFGHRRRYLALAPRALDAETSSPRLRSISGARLVHAPRDLKAAVPPKT